MDHELQTGRATAPAGATLLLTVPEAAQRLAIRRSTAYELIARGELRSVHIGRCHRVPVEALDELLDRLDRQDT